jgi:mannose-6-phosphate isomerase-like protein (cupin superfamily)
MLAMIISLPLSGQQAGSLPSGIHLNEQDVPWPPLVSAEDVAALEAAGTDERVLEDIRRLDEVMRWKTLVGTGGRFGEGLPDPDIAFGIGEMGPGAFYPPHRHPSPELYYFVAGSAKWTVDGEEFIATPGSTVYMKPNAVHSIEVVSDEKAIIVWADWSPDGNMEAMQGGYELLEHVPEQPERARLFGDN